MDPSSSTNRDPNAPVKEMTKEELTAFPSGSRHSTLSRDLQTRYGSIQPARRQALALAQKYHDTNPGRPTWGDNTTLEGQIFIITQGKSVTWKLLSDVFGTLEYGMSCNKVATFLLLLRTIRLPNNKLCAHWDPSAHSLVTCQVKGKEADRWHCVYGMVATAQIFTITPALRKDSFFKRRSAALPVPYLMHTCRPESKRSRGLYRGWSKVCLPPYE
jgi:hypothetical protein